MKIAIASQGKNVSGHFGHCEGFIIYDVNEAKVLKKELVENPGHKPGYLPVFLKELNVDLIIAGGMGDAAQQLFEENGIDVIVGAHGLYDDAIQEYLKGELKSSKNTCSEHDHEGDCN
ncbi:MAG: NifB/NifX family molybdenum-iron cluster-binding protein [Clostridium sp.]|uniref:NifB/NifX family molybdenum-iron cluster-binding protein n=1 Tax=Clostridium sp. TaxID=1506 RepID=UPI003D6DA0FB